MIDSRLIHGLIHGFIGFSYWSVPYERDKRENTNRVNEYMSNSVTNQLIARITKVLTDHEAVEGLSVANLGARVGLALPELDDLVVLAREVGEHALEQPVPVAAVAVKLGVQVVLLALRLEHGLEEHHLALLQAELVAVLGPRPHLQSFNETMNQ